MTSFKYFTVMLLSLGSLFYTYAQINIGSLEKPNARDGAGLIRKSEMRRMQRNKVIFFYGDRDEARLETLKKTITKAWTLGPIEFEHIRNFKKYERARNTAFITLETDPVYKVNTNIGKKTEIDCQVYYHLWVPKSRKKITYARIDLYPTHDFVKQLIKVEKPEAKQALVYQQGQFYNDSPGLMSIYLKHLSRALSTDDNYEGESLYEDIALEDSASLGLLRHHILYAPRYILAEEAFREGEVTYRAAIDLFEDYPYRYEIVKREALSDLILEATELLYIFIYVQSGEDKHFSVFKTNGELLFHEFEGNSLNLKENDLRELARSVED